MNNTDQIRLLFSMFATQLPTLLVCFVAGVVILGKWKEGSKGSMWALFGFGVAAILCFAVPVAQTAAQGWLRHGSHTAAEGASVMAGISMVWSVLRAVSYALLLIAVFAGRSPRLQYLGLFDPDKTVSSIGQSAPRSVASEQCKAHQ